MAWYRFRIHRMHHLRLPVAFQFVDYHRIAPMDSPIFTWTKKMCLTKESKLGMKLPYIPSLGNGKKAPLPKDSSAVWRSQLPSGDTCPFSFTRAVAWNSNKTKKKRWINLSVRQEEASSFSVITAKSVWSLSVGSCQTGSLTYLEWVGNQPLCG